MKNIETKWLYDFLTLEACRNFCQAAKDRNLSQPAFSRRIKALESAIGVVLFDRTTSPLQLTEEGRLFHSQTRSLVQQLECNLNELGGIIHSICLKLRLQLRTHYPSACYLNFCTHSPP